MCNNIITKDPTTPQVCHYTTLWKAYQKNCAIFGPPCISVAAAAGIDDRAGVELKQPSRVNELVEGVEMILKCHVDGNQEPTVDWFRNYER